MKLAIGNPYFIYFVSYVLKNDWCQLHKPFVNYTTEQLVVTLHGSQANFKWSFRVVSIQNILKWFMTNFHIQLIQYFKNNSFFTPFQSYIWWLLLVCSEFDDYPFI